jgi:hypothetical protein
MTPPATDVVGFILLAIAILTFVQFRMALSFGKRLGETKVLEEKMNGLQAQVHDIKTNDLHGVDEDIKALRVEVGGLRNAIFHNMQETIRDVIKSVVGSGCASATCPYLADKNKEPQG